MPKYVCDFDTVKKVGQDVISAANEMNSSSNTYGSRISTDLSGWNGQAKATFITQCTDEVNRVVTKSKDVLEFGEFIVKSAQSIEELDNSLATITF